MSFRLHTASVLFGLVLLVGCGGGEEPTSEPGSQSSATMQEEATDQSLGETDPPVPVVLNQDQVAGRQVYETVCWTCHGESGRGEGPAVESGQVPQPPDLTSDVYASATAEELQARFAELPDADPEHPHMRVVRSLLTEERFAQALTYVPILGYPAEVPGAAMRGREVYQFRCAACHGEAGEGDGPAADILATPPADFTTDTLIAAGDFESLFQRVHDGGAGVHGSSMPPWGVLMSDTQIWDLVAYIATFQDVSFTPPTG